jgi:ribosomal protein L3
VSLQLKDTAKMAEYQPGQQLDIAEMFKEGDSIDIAGTTVGKGFQGE